MLWPHQLKFNPGSKGKKFQICKQALLFNWSEIKFWIALIILILTLKEIPQTSFLMMDREVTLNSKNETQTGDLRLKKNTREK